MWRALPRTLRGPEGVTCTTEGTAVGPKEEDGVKRGSFINLSSHDLMHEVRLDWCGFAVMDIFQSPRLAFV